MEELGYIFDSHKLIKKYIVSGSYMFSELNIISVKGIKKISEPKNRDIENPEIIWLSRGEVKEAIYNSGFEGLTYATAALIWLTYDEKNKIWITGKGMVGKALIKTLSKDDKYEVISTSRKNLIKQIKKLRITGLKK